MRRASVKRETEETAVEIEVDLDGSGSAEIATGVGFFDHMLDQVARHGMLDLKVRTRGDREVDDHHTVEDTGLALGQAVREALGDKRGIVRFADCLLPMDEALTRVALDFSGRPFLVFRTTFARAKIGTFDTDLVREFFQAFAVQAGLTLHVETLYGDNAHHIAESCFKGLARALRAAVALDERNRGRIPLDQGFADRLTHDAESSARISDCIMLDYLGVDHVHDFGSARSKLIVI